MVTKILERHDPGHKGTDIRVNFDHVATYAEYIPKEAGGKPVAGFTVLAMTNGQVVLGKIDIKNVDQIMKVNSK